MTIERVKRACEIRGIYFNGEKKWLNSTVGYGYSAFSPNGYGILQADTINGFYKLVKKFPVIER